MKVFQFILFIPIQIVFLPITIFGLLIGIYKEMVIGKKIGVSFSAIKALQYRWYGHYFGIRPDLSSVKFIKKLPCESHFALWSIMGPLILSNRLFGYTTKSIRKVEPEDTFHATAITRVRVFDRIMDKYIANIEQVVLPGAGFDLISLGYLDHNIKVYELDQESTLQLKEETLKKAGVDHDKIAFIPVDYEKEYWDKKLLDAGFDKTKKTLFIWQSVSLFLEPELVNDSLNKMAELCSKGSIIVQDFYSKAFLEGEISKMAKKQFRLFEKQGESVKFALDLSEDPEQVVEEFLSGFGMSQTNYI